MTIKDKWAGFLAKLRRAHKSATIWANAAAAGVVSAIPYIADQYPALQPYMGADLYKHIGLVIVAANIALRFKTSTALHDK